MHATMIQLMQASRRSSLRGLGQSNPNLPATTCPACPKTNVIWYIGTAIGGITLASLFLRAVAN